MSTKLNKIVIQRWFDAINKKDLVLCDKIADETYGRDFVLHDPSFPNSHDSEPGPERAKKFVRYLLVNSPDVQLSIDDMIEERDKVVTRFTVHRTEANTGKSDTSLGLTIIRFVDGKFAEEWELVVPGKW